MDIPLLTAPSARRRGGEDPARLRRRGCCCWSSPASPRRASSRRSRASATSHGWATFALLGTLAAAAQLFPVHRPRNSAFMVSSVFLLPAVFLLPLAAARADPARAAPARVAEGALPVADRERSTSRTTRRPLRRVGRRRTSSAARRRTGPGWALAGIAAAARLAVLNHGLLAPMLSFAKGQTIRRRASSRSRASRASSCSRCSASRSRASGS